MCLRLRWITGGGCMTLALRRVHKWRVQVVKMFHVMKVRSIQFGGFAGRALVECAGGCGCSGGRGVSSMVWKIRKSTSWPIWFWWNNSNALFSPELEFQRSRSRDGTVNRECNRQTEPRHLPTPRGKSRAQAPQHPRKNNDAVFSLWAKFQRSRSSSWGDCVRERPREPRHLLFSIGHLRAWPI